MSMRSSSRRHFTSNIGISTSTRSRTVRQICEDITFAQGRGANANVIVNNLTGILGSSKIDALKAASKALFNQIDTADPNKKYVRTGLSAYSNYVRGTTNMEWGTAAAASYVESTYARGGTSSTESLKWAYNQLKSSNPQEVNAHKAKNGDDTPDRFILFMTDGDNNYTSDDSSTIWFCTQAKNDGITIYTVAFDAPARGRTLLAACATSADHYFEAKTSDELIKAFEEIGRSSVTEVPRLTM